MKLEDFVDLLEKVIEQKRPEKNPKIYTPKQIMHHLLSEGWLEIRGLDESRYIYLDIKGYFSTFFKRDKDTGVSEALCRYRDGINLNLSKIEAGEYFLIEPIPPEILSRKGRQGVDV